MSIISKKNILLFICLFYIVAAYDQEILYPNITINETKEEQEKRERQQIKDIRIITKGAAFNIDTNGVYAISFPAKDYKVLSYYRVKQPNRTPSHNYEIRLDNITEEFTAEIRFSKASGDEYFINIADEPNYSLTYNYSSQSFSFEFTTKKNLRLQKFFLFKDLENNYYIRHSDSKNYLSFTPDGQKLAWGNLKRALDRMEYDENEPEIYYDAVHMIKNVTVKITKLYLPFPQEDKEGILNKTKIDLILKYDDLSEELIFKDRIYKEHYEEEYQNEQLRYCLRSIMKNMPWINKIFLVMPHDHFHFLVPQFKRKGKIIKINDMDFIGHLTASSQTQEFNLWRLKKMYNVSNYVIYMNENAFINHRLEKDDFFYVEYGKVIPLITNPIEKLYKRDQIYDPELNITFWDRQAWPASLEAWFLKKKRSIAFLLYLAKDYPIKIAQFKGTPIPLRLDEVEEIYKVIEKKYLYPEKVLDCIEKNNFNPQFQILYMNYYLNKYDRVVMPLRHKKLFIKNLNYSKLYQYKNYDMFHIRYDLHKNLTLDMYNEELMILDALFPEPFEFEKNISKIEKRKVSEEEFQANNVTKEGKDEDDLDDVFSCEYRDTRELEAQYWRSKRAEEEQKRRRRKMAQQLSERKKMEKEARKNMKEKEEAERLKEKEEKKKHHHHHKKKKDKHKDEDEDVDKEDKKKKHSKKDKKHKHKHKKDKVKTHSKEDL